MNDFTTEAEEETGRLLLLLKCEEYFFDECEKHTHTIKCLQATQRHVTRDFSHASPVPQKPEECPAHSSELNLFCPTHYVLCCSKCEHGKDGAHKGCPVVPFDEEDNLKAVHSNLEADIAALREKAEAMAGPTVAELSKKQKR